MNESKYFLPYQIEWLRDDSPVKIWDKSRRIGATYVQSFEDVRDCVKKTVPAVFFSSADESAAREYILYAEKWAQIFEVAAKYLGEIVIDSDKGIKAHVISLANGTRLHALTSNPKGFRSKGGKVVLDEFAHHEKQDEMWAAAEPCTTWGFPLRILSTDNGQSCLFYKFIQDIKRGKLDWSLHTTTLQQAVDQGLLDKILRRKTTDEEKKKWLDEKRKRCRTESIWLQEYCCVAVDETTSFLSYAMIGACEREGILCPLEEITGNFYVGMDIGRRKHVSVIWGIEQLGYQYLTRIRKVLEKAKFRFQREALYEILSHPNMRRACIDDTGLGMQLAEEAQDKFGKYRVEPVTFTAAVKEDIAFNALPYFEDIAILIPPDPEVREDFHSVKKLTTSAGNIRFDVDSAEESEHADNFWACGLSLHAASSKNSGPIRAASRGTREAAGMFKGY